MRGLITFEVPVFSLLLLFLSPICFQTVYAQNKAVGPILRVYEDPFDFDSIRCRVRHCLPMRFENIGDTVLTVYNHERINRPFYARVDTPFTLQPGESRTFDICFTPTAFRSDSQRIFIGADTRVPLSIAMLFDISASMILYMPDGTRRIEAARHAGMDFVGHLLDTLGIEDEAAMYTYDITQNFNMTQGFTKDTSLLRAGIPEEATGTATCTFNALARVIDSLRHRSNRRVIVILTDGDNSGNPPCGPVDVSTVLQKASETNTVIYAIGIGDVTDHTVLQHIARSTGGEYFYASTSLDLLSMYRQVATELSKNNRIEVGMRGVGIAPRIEIEPMQLDFGSVQVGQTKCVPVSIRNGGNETLPSDSVRALFRTPYSVQGLLPDSIKPYQTVQASLCFTPLLPLDYTQALSFLPSPCEVFHDTIKVTAQSFLIPRDSVNNPVLDIQHPEPSFDTTFCGTTECIELLFRNPGDTAVTVLSMDEIAKPFSGSIPTPFTIPPGASQAFTVCYSPDTAPRTDTLRLGYEAEVRVPQGVSVLLDRGIAMEEEFMPGLSKLTAGIAAASDFMNGLDFQGKLPDVMELAYFDSLGNFTGSGFLSDKSALQNEYNDTTVHRPSCLYAGLAVALERFSAVQGSRKLVLVTSGVDAGPNTCGQEDASAVAQRALALGVRIYCIHIGDASGVGLALLAQQTGGSYHQPDDLLEMMLALRGIESEYVEHSRFELPLVARGVTPIAMVSADILDFGASDTGATVCRSLVIRNVGDAPMRISNDTVLDPPFHLDCSESPVAPSDTMLVLPGDSLELYIAFRPLHAGVSADTLMFSHDGCMQDAIRITLRGVGILRSHATWVYPSFAHFPGEIDLGTASCGERLCTTFPITNTEATISRAVTIARPSPPFELFVDDTSYISANDDIQVQICYEPSASGADTSFAVFETSSRPNYGVVALLARDASMNTTLPDELTVDDVALAALRTLRDNIARDPSYDDVLEIRGFDESGMRMLERRSISDVQQPEWPPHAAEIRSGELASALFQAIDAAMLLDGSRHVMVFASELHVAEEFDAAEIAAKASAAGVHMHMFLFAATGEDSIRAYADRFWDVHDYSDLHTLEMKLHEATLRGLKLKRDTVYVSGNAVSPELEVEPTRLSFGTLSVGVDRCLPMTLRNTGGAPLRITGIDNPREPFPTIFPQTIEPGGEFIVDVCYLIRDLGADSTVIRIFYDACGPDTVFIHANANGSDSVNVGMFGEFSAMPGHVVSLPLRLFGRIPSNYDVISFSFTVSFNKTMLYPLEPQFGLSPSLVDAMRVESVSIDKDFSDTELAVTYTIRGSNPLNNPSLDSVLVYLPFLVLLGNATETPLNITQVRFGDGLPRAGVAVNGKFFADSLCFLEQRLLDTSERRAAKISGASPNPFTSTVTLSYEVFLETHVLMTVHDALGRMVAKLVDGELRHGTYSAVFDATGLPPGIYVCRLEAKGQVAYERLISIR